MLNRPHRGLLICLTILLGLAVVPHQTRLAQARINATSQDAPSAQPNSEGSGITSPADVSHAIELATDYLERACGPNGKFAYRIDIASGRGSASYDIIRHAGTIYALAMANRSRPDPKVVETMVRAAGFLRRNYIGPSARPGQLVVWSKPLTETPERQYAELGGSALSLVALSAVRQVDPESVPLKDLQGLGQFVLFLQKDDGSFVHKYHANGKPVMNSESLYYPGEAALGLIALYEADHDRDWLNASAKALAYLAKSRAGLDDVPADHWALIATAELLPYCEPNACAISLKELTHHAAQICNSILKEQLRSGSGIGLDGAFDPTGRTAPAATRLEGLLAALEFLPGNELRERTESAVRRGVGFLLRMQVASGPHAGGMPGALAARASDASEIRIDYVQHALCAWLRYQKRVTLLDPTPKAACF